MHQSYHQQLKLHNHLPQQDTFSSQTPTSPNLQSPHSAINMQYFTIITLFLTAVTAAPLSVDAKVEIGAPVVKTGDSPIKLGDKNSLPIKVGDKDSLLRFGSANNNICTGTYKAPQCCTASVQGVANVDCIRRTFLSSMMKITN